jgi:hypothetical protein
MQGSQGARDAKPGGSLCSQTLGPSEGDREQAKSPMKR